MKTFLTFFLAMIGIVGHSFAQTYTDYPPGQRDPTYYYWDSNWVDVKGTCGVSVARDYYKTSFGRYCYTVSSLHVIGIAVTILIDDDTTKSMQPEYLQLYEIGDSCDLDLRLLAEARWDTVIPHKRIGFHTYVSNADYYPVYEVYFDKPYLVEDSFYVVCTQNSNAQTQDERGWIIDPYRGFFIIAPCDPYTRWWLDPPYVICRTYEPMTNNPNWPWNMNWARREMEHKRNLAIFPIFDTTGINRGGGIVHDTACLQEVRGLSVLDVNAESATLMWDGDGQLAWEVSYGHSGTPADSGTILSTTSSITTLEGLDTSSWYVAYVRSICPNSAPGAWSDSVRFYVPADTTHRIEPTGTPSLISLYTQIMPNPAKDEVMVISSFSISQIEVFSLAGKLLDSFDYGNVLQTRLKVDSYPSGAYFIRIHTPSGTTTKKLIIR